jgi:creatinine amidohydrolase/Fe(II)-dependent formamide hydrolase-like protein
MNGASDMPSKAATEYRYEKLTWPEINDAVDLGKVCILPCGAVEQHGPHLPLDVDVICPTEIARGAGRIIPEKILVLPTIRILSTLSMGFSTSRKVWHITGSRRSSS